MNDDEFLGYVDIHCETPRALFSGTHVFRLFDMAGEPRPDIYATGFYGMHEDVAKPLLVRARARLAAAADGTSAP